MNKNYIFGDKMQIFKALNERIVNENRLLSVEEIDKYDAIFNQKTNIEYTPGERIILILWDVEKEYLLKGEIEKIKKINSDYDKYFGLILDVMREIVYQEQFNQVIEQIVEQSIETGIYFRGDNNEKINRYKKSN